MRTYEIAGCRERVPLVGDVAGTPWEQANELCVDRFNWHDGGPKPETTARLLYDDEALSLQFQVEDYDISSTVTELNGPTYADSSVELFADPNPDADSHYFNFEANCCGYFKLAWQEKDWEERGIGRDLVPADLADAIRVETSIDADTREPQPDDDGWWLAATIPFETLASFTGVDIAPESGTTWRANVYRSGVESPSQKSTWNPMPTPEPDYHSPEFFGRLRFA
jgi:hypothetical protein